MANISLKEKFLAVTNAKRLADGEPSLSMAEIDWGDPVDYSGARSTKSKRLYLTPKPSSLVVGRSTVYYDQINLSTITTLMVVKGAAAMVADLLPQISDEMGVTLELADITNAALPGSGTTFTLTASATNLLYKGSCTVTFTT